MASRRSPGTSAPVADRCGRRGGPSGSRSSSPGSSSTPRGSPTTSTSTTSRWSPSGRSAEEAVGDRVVGGGSAAPDRAEGRGAGLGLARAGASGFDSRRARSARFGQPRPARRRRDSDTRLAIGEPGQGLAGWRLTHHQARAALAVAQRDRTRSSATPTSRCSRRSSGTSCSRPPSSASTSSRSMAAGTGGRSCAGPCAPTSRPTATSPPRPPRSASPARPSPGGCDPPRRGSAGRSAPGSRPRDRAALRGPRPATPLCAP